jgi:hypothetical protein
MRLDIHMKIILYDWNDHLHFDNKEPINNTETIHTMHSTIWSIPNSPYLLVGTIQLVNNTFLFFSPTGTNVSYHNCCFDE